MQKNGIYCCYLASLLITVIYRHRIKQEIEEKFRPATVNICGIITWC